jgi:hypothetical protein
MSFEGGRQLLGYSRTRFDKAFGLFQSLRPAAFRRLAGLSGLTGLRVLTGRHDRHQQNKREAVDDAHHSPAHIRLLAKHLL